MRGGTGAGGRGEIGGGRGGRGGGGREGRWGGGWAAAYTWQYLSAVRFIGQIIKDV